MVDRRREDAVDEAAASTRSLRGLCTDRCRASIWTPRSPTLRTIEPDKGSPLEDKAPPKEDQCPHQGGADLEAMGRALAAVSARDVQGFFANCGYRAPAQHL